MIKDDAGYPCNITLGKKATLQSFIDHCKMTGFIFKDYEKAFFALGGKMNESKSIIKPAKENKSK